MRLGTLATFGVTSLLLVVALTLGGEPLSATFPSKYGHMGLQTGHALGAEHGPSLAWDEHALRAALRRNPTWRAVRIVAEVDSVDDSANIMRRISVGDRVTATYLYDPAAGIADSSADPTIGHYDFSEGPFGVVMRLGRYRFHTDRDATTGSFGFQVVNDLSDSFYDSFSFGSSFTSHPRLQNRDYVGVVTSSSFELVDFTGTALSSDALPAEVPDLDDWQIGIVAIYGYAFNELTRDVQDLAMTATVVSTESVAP